MYQAASPETILSERYEITDERVDVGTAYFRAFGIDRQTGRAVFMKALNANEDEAAGDKIRSEAEHTASLHHRQIPGLIEADPLHEYPYLVTERVPGTVDVSRQLKHRPNHNLAATICLSAAEVLDYVHRQRKVHGDVNEGNLPARLSVAYLVDLGEMTDESQEHDPTGTFRGTFTHIAPEQMRGDKPTPRSDIHGLGATMYALTYGRPTFYGDPEQVFQQRVTQDIRFWPVLRGTPDALRHIIQKATQPDPSYRYESMAAMAEELRQFLADSAVSREAGVSILVPVDVAPVSPDEDMPTEQFKPLPRLAEVA